MKAQVICFTIGAVCFLALVIWKNSQNVRTESEGIDSQLSEDDSVSTRTRFWVISRYLRTLGSFHSTEVHSDVTHTIDPNSISLERPRSLENRKEEPLPIEVRDKRVYDDTWDQDILHSAKGQLNLPALLDTLTPSLDDGSSTSKVFSSTSVSFP